MRINTNNKNIEGHSGSFGSVRTRIAPSPTGYPHIGTIYQALFDYSFAKKNAGQFIIRIEDTDRERFVQDAEEKIYEAFDWFSLTENESPRKGGDYSPYRQSERLDIYAKYAKELCDKGGAYYCFCTKERLEDLRNTQQAEKKPLLYDKHCLGLPKDEIENKLASRQLSVLRLNVPRNETIIAHDELRGDIEFDSNTIDDSILIKSDSFPTYHLAVVVDDYLMKITHIVRGEEWISSFPKHVLLYKYFDWEIPLFFHTPVLRNPDKSKLSKRQGHTNVSWYQEEGYLPEVILNFLALLGWTHPEGKEIFDLDEFTKLFELKDLRPVAPIFDIQKLTWMNGMYIREVLSISELVRRLEDFYIHDEEISKILREKNSERFGLLIDIARTRMKTLKDFRDFVSTPAKEERYENEQIDMAKSLSEKLLAISDQDWDEENILRVLKDFCMDRKVSMKIAYVLLTGKPNGLPLPQFLKYLGKDKSISRLSRYL